MYASIDSVVRPEQSPPSFRCQYARHPPTNVCESIWGQIQTLEASKEAQTIGLNRHHLTNTNNQLYFIRQYLCAKVG